MPRERWKPVAGYEGLYDVSDRGRVRNARTKRVRVLKRTTRKGGTIDHRISLYRDGKEKVRTVSHLVLEAFIGPRPSEAYEASHLDDNSENNRLGNLIWQTHAENMRRRRRLMHHSGNGRTVSCDGLPIGKRSFTFFMADSDCPDCRATYPVFQTEGAS